MRTIHAWVLPTRLNDARDALSSLFRATTPPTLVDELGGTLVLLIYNNVNHTLIDSHHSIDGVHSIQVLPEHVEKPTKKCEACGQEIKTKKPA